MNMSTFCKIPTYYANFNIYNIPKAASAPARLNGMCGKKSENRNEKYEYRTELLRERYLVSVNAITPQDTTYGLIFILPKSPLHDLSAPSPSPTNNMLQPSDFKDKFKKDEDVIFIYPDSPMASPLSPQHRSDSPFCVRFKSPSWTRKSHGTIYEDNEDD